MVGRTPKITAATWIDTARRSLIDEGIAGVKIDRLASRLGVTRGGFYHNFKDRDEFLDRLLDHWKQTCRFLPDQPPGTKPADGLAWLEEVVRRLIESDGYDYHFDLSVREWARADKRAAWAVERADKERLTTLQRCFEALGYDQAKAAIRARVFYYHQIGYYAIGVRQSIAERRQNAVHYIEILCGEEALANAREEARRTKGSAVAV